MTVSRTYEWHLQSRSTGACGEAAVLDAIANGSAMLSLGPHQFIYSDDELLHGGHVLTLTPVLRDGERDVLDGCLAEQRVPRRLVDWNDDSDARLVEVLGMALFRDVARLVSGTRHESN